MHGIKALSTSIFCGLFVFRSLKRVRGLQIPRFIHNPQPFSGSDTRLIVGYVSGAGFQKTPGTSASRGVFQFHDRSRFRIQCAGLRADVRSNDLRPNITNSCEKFFDFSRFESQHEELGRQLNALGWHILVDMSGLSGHHYVETLALKPAPVVVTWLEYPGRFDAEYAWFFVFGDSLAVSVRVSAPRSS
jgi:protein O-GlcNAc transferase